MAADATASTEYDFVIVGSGAGGLVAAIRAKALGLRAIVLEKQDKVGGSTGLSGGVLWVPCNPAQKRAGVSDSLDEARTYLEHLVGLNGGRGATIARREAFLNNAPAMISFLEEQGIPFLHCKDRSDYHDELPGGRGEGRSIETPLFDGRKIGRWFEKLQGSANPYPVRGSEMRYVLLAQARLKGTAMLARMVGRMALRKVTGRKYVGVGAGLAGRLFETVLKRGVPVLNGAGVKRFLVEQDRVVGVVAEVKGQEREFRSKAVLLAAGGFAQHSAMRSQYGTSPFSLDWTLSNPGDTGEMMREAMELGADVDMMDFCWWVPMTTLPNGQRMLHVAEIAKPGSIVVDQAGNRFVDEAGSYVSFGQAMYKRNREAAAIPGWCVMDSRYRSRYPWAGRLPLQTPEEWFKVGYMKRAHSIAELALQCDIDPGALEATITRFNQFVDKGRDEDYQRGGRIYDGYYADPYHRPSPTLGRIDQSPYYAVKIFPGDIGTAGGLVVDEHARVLRKDGTPIEGLLATGNITAPVFGATYPGAGASIAPSALFGYIAALTATRT